MEMIRCMMVAIGFALCAFSVSAQQGGGADFSQCDSFTGAANGLCRAGLGADCDLGFDENGVCAQLALQFEKAAGALPPWASEPCGDAICGTGTVCCNASCGICAPSDCPDCCIQIVCQ